MKKILLLSLVLLSVISCQKQGDFVSETESNEISFKIDIPQESVVDTKAPVESGMITNLTLLVFDQNGLFRSRHTATPNGALGNYKVFLPLSSSQCIIHFVANSSWDNFSDVQNIGRAETDLIPRLETQNGVVSYWTRVVVPNIQVGSLSSTISLLRNVLKVSVVNLTTGSKKLNTLQFAMGDYFKTGTAAPFDADSDTFTEGVTTESPAGVRQPILANDFLVAGLSLASTGAPYYTYERENSTATHPSYVIIKGYYQKDATPNTTVLSYYKVDIVEATAVKLYDLKRNYHYILKINSVTNAGYPSLAEATNAPASNNISASVLVQEFTSVTNGLQQLNVDNTNRLFVTGGKDFTINYSYIPNITTGTINNSTVTISLTQDALKPVLLNGTWINTASTGKIDAKTAPLPPLGQVYTATLTITAGGLKRDIKLSLRNPLQLTAVSATPNPVANLTDQPVELKFTIPTFLGAEYFPMPIYITTKKLSPNLATGTNSHLTLDLILSNNQYRYIYTAQQSGEQTVYFNTNSTNSDETIQIVGDYFQPATTNLTTTTTQTALNSLAFSPNGATLWAQKDETVTMTFNIPVVAGVNPPYNVTIQTGMLTFVSSANGTAVPASNGYLFTTNTTGTKSLIFKTNASNSQEYVRLTEPRYASVGATRSCTFFDFVNSRADVALSQVGAATSIRFGLPAAYSMPAHGGVCEVYIYTANLEPATGNPSGLVAVSDPRLGSGYKYTTTVYTDQAAQFKTKVAASGETVVVKSESFNQLSILRTVTSAYLFDPAAFSAKPRSLGNTTTTTTLTFTVPEGSIPAGGLQVRINSQDALLAYPTSQAGLVRVGDATDVAGYFTYTVTTPGVQSLTFRLRSNTTSVKRRVITISAPNFTTTVDLNS